MFFDQPCTVCSIQRRTQPPEYQSPVTPLSPPLSPQWGAGLKTRPFVSKTGIARDGNKDCTVGAAPVLPASYVVSASRIADRRVILAGYHLADLLKGVAGN